MKKPRLTRSDFWRRCAMNCAVFACVLCAGAALTENTNALYILTGVEDNAIVLDSETAIPDLSDYPLNAAVSDQEMEVTLSKGQNVTIYHDGASISVVSKEETIDQLLSRIHIVPGALDTIGVDVSPAGVVLTVASELTVYEHVSEPAAFQTIRQPNENLEMGTEQIVQEGADGTRTAVYEVVYSNGEKISRQLIGYVNNTAVDEIIEYGTAIAVPEEDAEEESEIPEETVEEVSEPEPIPEEAVVEEVPEPEPIVEDIPEEEVPLEAEAPQEATVVTTTMPAVQMVTSVSSSDRIQSVSQNADGSGLLTFQSGVSMAFSSVRNMTATAYTKGYGGVGSITATGTIVSIGTVAVDPRVIPLGTRMYIVTSDGSIVYGMSVACDTGVKGNIVDLYYDTYNQCVNFGRRNCTVYLLK